MSVVGRNTKGVIVMDVEEDDAVAAVDVIPASEATDDENAGESDGDE